MESSGPTEPAQAAAEAPSQSRDPRTVEAIVQDLSAPDWHVAQAAAAALAQRGGSAAVAPLVAALALSQLLGKALVLLHRVVQLAEGVAQLEAPGKELEALDIGWIVGLGLRERRNFDWHVGQAAATALGDLADARAVDPLIDALASSNWRIRQAATVALGRIGDPRAIEPLVAALADRDWHVGQAAAAALGGIGDPRAIEPLVAALLASDAEVRRAASEALASIGWAPRNAGERAAWSIANDAWSTCVEIGVPAVEPLVTVLGVGGASGRQAAASALGMIGDPRAIDPLVAALRDYYAHVRETSATALGMIGDPRAIDPLVAALRDAYPEVRQAAAGALGEIGGAAVGPLIAVFDDPGSRAEERVWAARSLVEIYQSGRLGEAARLDILRRRQEIEHTHYDVQGGASCTKPSRHTDLGAVFDG